MASPDLGGRRRSSCKIQYTTIIVIDFGISTNVLRDSNSKVGFVEGWNLVILIRDNNGHIAGHVVTKSGTTWQHLSGQDLEGIESSFGQDFLKRLELVVSFIPFISILLITSISLSMLFVVEVLSVAEKSPDSSDPWDSSSKKLSESPMRERSMSLGNPVSPSRTRILKIEVPCKPNKCLLFKHSYQPDRLLSSCTNRRRVFFNSGWVRSVEEEGLLILNILDGDQDVGGRLQGRSTVIFSSAIQECG